MLEGSGISKLRQMIQKHGHNDFDRFELATVTSPPPSLRFRVDSMTMDLEADDVIVAQHLTAHDRTISLNGGADSTLSYKDELVAGDRVIVVSMSGGQTYVILDRAVIY